MDRPLRTLAGRYRLEEVIGRGGMSTVYRATDRALGRTVAVKVLLDALVAEDPTYVARFEREARAAAALDSPAVVTIFDAGVDGASRYIVMEYVEGESLASRLRRQGRLAPAEAMRLGSAVAGALATAHAAGILHRDIKPANVMLTASGSVKVLDFGIARPRHEATLTQTSSLVGTAAYMAPERAMGGAGDERSDVYSLGCLVYAMLTGAAPFGGELPAAVLQQHVSAEPAAPGRAAPGIPAGLDTLVLEMLAKDPGARPQTAAEARDRLEALSDPTRVTAPLPAAPTPASGRPGRGPLVVALLLAAALLVGGGVALLVTGGRARRPVLAPRTTSPTTTPATTVPPTTTPAASTPAPPPKKKPPGPGPPGHGGAHPKKAHPKPGH